MIHEVEKDMTTTRREFYRNLATVLHDLDHTTTGDETTITSNGKTITIAIHRLPARALSPLMKLERWQVKIRFDSHTEQQRKTFLARFDKAFQRGGG